MVLHLFLACFALEKEKNLNEKRREGVAGARGMGLDGC